MRRLIISIVFSLALVLFVYMLVTAEGKPSTEELVNKATRGTWLLVSRELPDGTIMKPPEISGLTITTEKYSCMTALNPLGNGKFNVWVMGTTDSEISDESMKFKSILFASISQGSESRGTVNPKPNDMEWGVEIVDGRVKFNIDDGSEFMIDGDTAVHTFTSGRKETWKKVE